MRLLQNWRKFKNRIGFSGETVWRRILSGGVYEKNEKSFFSVVKYRKGCYNNKKQRIESVMIQDGVPCVFSMLLIQNMRKDGNYDESD